MTTPANHVPFGTATCQSCHAPSNFSTFLFANKSGTAPPSMVHSVVSSTACSTCHEAGKSFIGSPPVVVRPAKKADGTAHVATGECSTCHSGTTSFKGATDLPPDHIPLPAADNNNCALCHTGGNYSVATMNHANITANCAQCHATGKSFANIAPPALKVPPNNHIPFGTATCESCHSASNFTTFQVTNKSPPMNHSAVSSIACSTCHAQGKSFVGAPPTVTTPANHVPFGTATCQSCHAPSNFTTFSFANKSGTAPPSMVHSVVSSTACSTCHEAGKSFVGSPAVVVRPAKKADGTAHVATGECSTCHSGTTSFKGATDLPPNHIPLPAADNNCALCHTTGNYSAYVMNHVNITTNCAQCHAYGLSFANMAPPTLVQPPAGATGHIPSNKPNGPTDIACELCHTPTVFTTFSGTIMKHAAVRGMTCMSCHELGMTWKTNTGRRLWVRDGANHHKGVDCGGSGCHSTRDRRGLRPGLGAVQPGVKQSTVPRAPTIGGAAIAGPGGFDHRRIAGQTCATCHNGASATGKPSTHLATSNSCESCHATFGWLPVARVDHSQVKGTCASCHDGTHAAGKSGQHIASSNTCESCHTTNAWLPARVDHASIGAHACATCHDSVHASGKPATHIPTTESCDSCHGTLAWRPVRLDHTKLSTNCMSCHNGMSATGKPSTHMVLQRDCASCHSYPDWTVVSFTHVSTNYPGEHHATLECASCHTSNTDKVPYASAADAGSCGACHAKDFKADAHPKTASGLKYNASELRNCSGACHVYSDDTLTTITKLVPGPRHRVSDPAFKH